MAVALLLAGLFAGQVHSPQATEQKPPATVIVEPGDRVEVFGNNESRVRGRLLDVTPDAIVLRTPGADEKIPLATIRQADRVGDSLANGSAIGAAIGGGSALALMAKICSNTNCSDTSSNLDPRLALLGTAIGAGIGALLDGVFEGRKTIYRTETGQTLTFRPPRATAGEHATIFGTVGWGRIDDDEGSLGSGTSMGAGVIVPFTDRFGVRLEYDRHSRSREFEFGRGFFGTEQLVTAKALFFFRSADAIRPYAGVGIGFMDSRRRSVSPTFTIGPGFQVSPGPVEIFHYHSTGATLGFAAGIEARLASRLSVLGDLAIDLGSPETLSSTRLAIGAGWRF